MGSRQSTSAPVTTTTQTDARQVVDAGGGIVGSGNVWDQSTRYTDARQSFTDASDRSVTTWTDQSQTSWWQDNSNRSTTNLTDSRQTSWWQDNSNRSSTSITMIDGGALDTVRALGQAQAVEAGRIARDAIEAARSSAASSAAAVQRAQEAAASAMSDSQARAFGLVESTARLGYQSGRDALGWAGERFDTIADLTEQVLDASRRNAEGAASSVAAAYTSARDQASGTRTLTIAALAAVGLVAAFVVFRKG